MSTVELSSGKRASAAVQIRASSASSEIFGLPGAFITARACMSSVASASTQQVASGISRRLRESLSATAPRTPRRGIRVPGAVRADVREAAVGGVADVAVPETAGAVALPARGGAVTARAAGVSAAGAEAAAVRSACSTSARRIRPSGPEPVSSRRSRPFSRASRRTSGEMTGTGPSVRFGAAAGAVGALPAAGGPAARPDLSGTAPSWGRTLLRRAGGAPVP